jgi:hypothetical protein
MNTARNLSMSNTLRFLRPITAIGVGMALAVLPAGLRAQDQTVTGNLTVDGSLKFGFRPSDTGALATNTVAAISNGYDGAVVGAFYAAPATNLLAANTGWNIATYGSNFSGYAINGTHGVFGNAGNEDTYLTTSLAGGLHIGALSNNPFANGLTAFSEKVTILSNGNVGIGTTIPGAKLTVFQGPSGDIMPTNAQATFEYSANGGIAVATPDANVAGVYFPTSTDAYFAGIERYDSTIRFRNNGATRLIIDSIGNTGIGTPAPGYNLTVAAAVKVFSTGVSSFILGKDSGTGTDYGKLTYDDSTGVLSLINPRTYPLTFQTNATERMRIDASGNVGIGTTSPQGVLSVTGWTRFNSTPTVATAPVSGKGIEVAYRTDNSHDDGAIQTYDRDTSVFKPLYVDGAKLLLNANSAGNVGIGTTDPRSTFHIHGSGANDGAHGFMLDASDDGNPENYNLRIDPFAIGNSAVGFQFKTKSFVGGANIALTFDNAGRVGVGTTTPAARLDVAGDAHVSGNLTINGTLNAANYSVGNGATAFPNTVSVGTTTSTGVLTVRTNSASPVLFLENNLDAGRNMSISPYISGVANGGFQIRDETAGASRLVINGNGEVGIGTTSPHGGLHIKKDFGPGFLTADTLRLDSGVLEHQAVLHLTDGVTSDGHIYFTPSATAPSRWVGLTARATDGDFIVNGNGNVGIGTTSLTDKLTVQGGSTQLYPHFGDTNSRGFPYALNIVGTDGSAAGNLMFSARNINDVSMNAVGLFEFAPNTGDLVYYSRSAAGNLVASDARLTIQSGGNVGIGSPSPMAKLDITADATYDIPQVIIKGAANNNRQLFFGYDTSNNFGFIQPIDQGIAYRNFIVNPHGGNVGIGTTTPSARLDVAGDAHISGDLTINGTLNAANYSVGNGATAFPNTVSVGTITSSGVLTVRTNSASPVLFLENNLDTGRNMSISPYISGVANGGFQIRDETAGASRLVINSDGNVGIGNTSPDAKLSITKDTTTITDENAYALKITDGNADTGLLAGVNATGHYSIIQSLDPSTGWTTRPLSLMPNGGNVGIGTTMPFFALTVGDQAGIGALTDTAGDLIGKTGLVFHNALGNYPAAAIANLQSNNYGGTLLFGTKGNGGGALTERMRIDYLGNVGIGTTTPGSYKLAVNGTIHAKDLVVDQSGWADYVLDPAYRNAPLSEVEQQIKEQGHLPGVPSAKDVAEKGVSVAQMQAVLLSKVEELTLHLIAQEKLLKEQSARISQLEAENASIRSR